MKLLLLVAFTLGLVGCGEPDLKDEKQKIGYAIGQDMGTRFKQQSVEVNVDAFVAGFKAGYNDKNKKLKDEEIRTILRDFQMAMMKKRQEDMQKQQEENNKNKDKNLEAGKKYLEENKTKEGVKVTASGLQYKILTEGKGAKPKETDKVKVHYKGTLTDGKQFDSSYDRGEPATFPVNGVIKGWIEGLQLMPVGSKWQLYIPAELAYGENGPPDIGPNQVLVFDVELIDIVK